MLPYPEQIPQKLKDEEIFWVDNDRQFMYQKNWKRPVTSPSFFLDKKLEWMDSFNIDKEVIITLSQLYCNGYSYENTELATRFQNEFNAQIQDEYPEDLRFELEGLDIWITHIAGRPGRYDQRVRTLLKNNPPNVLICGHSHILHVETDARFGQLQYLNPGAAGHHGFHQIRTLLKFRIQNGVLDKIRVIELGTRGRRQIPNPQ